MPMYHFCCEAGHEVRKLLKPEEVKQALLCECGLPLSRKVKGPSSQAVEVLDNGVMAKSVERLVDAERLYSERSEAATRNAIEGK